MGCGSASRSSVLVSHRPATILLAGTFARVEEDAEEIEACVREAKVSNAWKRWCRGTVTGQDPNGQVLTYTLTDNAGGRFAIDPVSGQITVANGILLDSEHGASRGIVVTPTLRPASRRSPRLRAAGWRADSGCQRLPPV